MFHNLMDVKSVSLPSPPHLLSRRCNPIHPLHNAYGHLTYGLGQAVQSLPFRSLRLSSPVLSSSLPVLEQKHSGRGERERRWWVFLEQHEPLLQRDCLRQAVSPALPLCLQGGQSLSPRPALLRLADSLLR
jgi:hypothetical protein